MGAEASKPTAQSSRDYEEPQGRVSRPFEVISPCSDISNPSDFNRVRYSRQTQSYQLQAPAHRPAPAVNGPYGPRRVSKDSSKGSNNLQNLPIAVKVRRSNSTAGASSNQMQRRSTSTAGASGTRMQRRSSGTTGNSGEPLGAFTFPTKESERQAERVAKKELRPDHQEIVNKLEATTTNKKVGKKANKMMKDIKKSVNTNINDIADNLKNMDLKENIKNMDLKKKTKKIRRGARKAAKTMKKKQQAFARIAAVIANACMEETKNMRLEQEQKKGKSAPKPSSNDPLDTGRPEVMPSASISRSRRRSEQVALGELQAAGTLKKDIEEKKKEPQQKKQAEPPTSVILHQEDVYFDRLSLSPSAQNGASPYVATNNRVTSILEGNRPDPEGRNDIETTPKDRKRISVESPMDTPVSDLFSASDSLQEHRDSEFLLASIKNKQSNASPVSSLMRFYTKTGPMEESSSPNSFASEEDEVTVNVFFDEQSEASSKNRESLESQSSLYTMESKINEGDLKLLGQGDNLNEAAGLSSYMPSRETQKKNKSKQKVSKLESLFRPILPALSTDDAQSVSSYDPYEIKVTESAPGVMQPSNYMALGVRRSCGGSSAQRAKKSQPSPSASVLSIDSQRESSSSVTKKMFSSQARINSDFLFMDDYGPVRVARNPNQACDPSKVSICTTEARGRLAQRSTQKGISIPFREAEREHDDVSIDMRSVRSERRVRFSEVSVKVLPVEEKEVFYAEEQEAPHDELECDRSIDPEVSNFRAAADRKQSIAESIDLPEIEANVSDLSGANVSTDTSECEAKPSRKSVDSIQSARSNHTTSIPESIPEEDEMTCEGSVHWTYSKNGVTPFVSAKSAPNPGPAKSPYFRFQKAKTQFSTEHLIMPPNGLQVSPQKSPKLVRKGSGGLVSQRIQELNHRVNEVRKIKRMRKKMTNPRLHTHNFDNTQPVRNRALMNYKTDIGSANLKKTNNFMAAKFNMIPDIDEDEGSTFSTGTYENAGTITSQEERYEDDDTSRSSEVTPMSVATVRQQRNSNGMSVSSNSTTSSGLTNLKKQVFRASDGHSIVSINERKSFASIGDETTMSSIIHKENENYLPFRSSSTVVKPSEQHFAAPPAALYVPPSKGTPAMKWRSLAAAAAEKDALKASAAKPKRTFGVRSMNCDEYHL